jgi:hypothetical protein
MLSNIMKVIHDTQTEDIWRIVQYRAVTLLMAKRMEYS